MTLIEKDPRTLAVIAGIVFGIWPYYLNKAGLFGINAPSAFCTVQSMFLLFVVALAAGIKGGEWKVAYLTLPLLTMMGIYSWLIWESKTLNWNKLLWASFFSSTGLICISQMLTFSTDATRSTHLATMAIVSICINATMYIVQNPSNFLWQRLLAYPSAALTIYLFYKSWK